MTDDLRAQLQAALGGAYTLERELGGGGMSRVFVARDNTLHRLVVVKTLAPELSASINLDRFQREVRLAARLQQANIVPVLASGEAGGTPYFTMPFVDGLSLRARLTQGPIPTGEALHILRDIAKALAFAHGQGVVHRDIKPENVLLSGGTAMVADFGIAKALVNAMGAKPGSATGNVAAPAVTAESLTQIGSALGTPAYIAPEQAAADPSTDHRADLYAWGVVAYELLGQRHPFAERTTPQSLLAAHMAEVPRPLKELQASLSPGLAGIVMRCLEKDPARRPQSATEVLLGLDNASTPGANVPAPPPVAAAPGGGRTRIMAGVAVALVVVAVGALLMRRSPSAPTTAVASGSRVAKSLAILPFVASGGDTANAYLAEGIAEEVNNRLSQVPGLKLAGRRSAASYAGKGASAQEIGAALQVANVLEGTVRRTGQRIRVTAELSSAEDGHVIWQQAYEKDRKEIGVVQDEMARAIAGQLAVTLSAGPNLGARDAGAVDLYLRGMYLFRRRAMAEARSALEQAVARDSTFAQAWAGLSQVIVIAPYYLPIRVSEVLGPARVAADRALRLEPLLAEGHVARALVLIESFDWPEAERELRRAATLDPGSAEPWLRLGLMRHYMGRPRDALPELQRAQALDPLNWTTVAYLGHAKLMRGEVEAGLADGRRAMELEPTSLAALNLLLIGYHLAGQRDSALVVGRQLIAARPSPQLLGAVSFVLARAGHRARAQALLARLEATPANTWRLNGGLLLAYLGLGDTTGAIAAMERAAAGDGERLQSMWMYLDHQLPRSERVVRALRRYHVDTADVHLAPPAPR